MTQVPVVSDRYVRQTIFPDIGRDGQHRLQAARVCLIGVGALGTHVADTLVRAGIGYLRIVDRDVPELSNLQRQTLFSEADIDAAVPKAVAAARQLAAVNSEVVVEPLVQDVNSTNVEPLIADVDFVVDGSDNFEVRYLINDAAVKHGKSWIYGGVIGAYGMTMTIRPGETQCLRCIFPNPPAPGDAPTCDTAGVIGPAVAAVAALEAAEAMKLALGAVDRLNGGLLSVDVWNHTYDRVALNGPDPTCPTCQRREFTFLEQELPTQMTELCGRDAVQVLIQPAAKISLPTLAERLSTIGEVAHNAYLLRSRIDDYELTVFPDGRAIIKGTTDPTEARSVYARYIGM